MGIEISIPKEAIQKIITEELKNKGYAPVEQLKGKTINLDEFRKKYCGGRGKAWVKEEILYKFKPDWVDSIHPGKGRRITIFEYPAANWMEEHRSEINWTKDK